MKPFHLYQKNLFVSKRLWPCGTRLKQVQIPAPLLLPLKQARTPPPQKNAPVRVKSPRTKHPMRWSLPMIRLNTDAARKKRRTGTMGVLLGLAATRLFLRIKGMLDIDLIWDTVPGPGPLAPVRVAQAPVVIRVTRRPVKELGSDTGLARLAAETKKGETMGKSNWP